MRRSFVVLLLVFGLLTPVSASAAPSGDDEGVPARAHADRNGNGLSDDLERDLADKRPGDKVDVVVTLDRPGSPAAAARAVGPFRVRRQFELVDGYAATMTVVQARALAARSEVFRVEPDFEVRVHNDASNADFGAAAARARGVDGNGIGVCVIDTGVDPGHEQFDTKTPIPFHDAINGRHDVAYDDHGHGTHVAGTAVGDGGDGDAAAYAGVAPAAKLLAAKVLSSSGSGSESQVVAGIDWCAGRDDVDVLSMSLGSGISSDGQDAISQAVDAATALGKVVVVAAGNSGDGTETVGSPGAAASAITVGAVAEWSSADDGAANASRGIHLAPWSSRGPTADGRTKPDVVAPGVTVTSARAGTTSGYATFSGTSMATPFTSGTVALMLEAGASPGSVKSIVTGTAQDRGPAGQDDDWGHGLIDAFAAVAQIADEDGATAFPTHTFHAVTLADNNDWTHAFEVTDAGTPVAATVLIDGAYTCTLPVGSSCWWYEWSGPDLDVELISPSGTVVQQSTCPLNCHTGSVGHQETIEYLPTTVGTYTLRVYPFDGTGGPFTVDLSHGPVGSGGGGGGTGNTPPTADDDSASTSEDTAVAVTLGGADAETCELAFAIAEGPSHGTLGSVGDAACSGTGPFTDSASVTYTPAVNWFGTDSFTYTVTDGQGTSDTATVHVSVTSVNDGDPAAGFSSSCTELVCAFTDESTDAADAPHGGIVSWSWSFGDGATSTARNPNHTYAAADTYTVELTVTDNDGGTATISEAVTVTAAPAPAITLEVTGTKVRGTKEAALRWTGTTSGHVDIYRDGSRIRTNEEDDGSYVDTIGKGGGSHTYRVCEAGKTDAAGCSNEATVSF